MKGRAGNILTTKNINRSTGGNLMMLLFLLLLSAFMLIPMIFVVSNAFKPLDELFIYPPRLFVQNPTLDNFSDMAAILSQSWVPFTRYLFNTLFITAVGTVGHILISSMAAFALAKHNFPGQKLMFGAIVLSLMFSGAVTGIPTYIMMSKAGLLDTWWAIILPSFQSSLGLYLMKQFMEGLPDSVLEATRIDGMSEIKIFWKIAMPMVKPAWLTLMILMIQSLWNINSPYIFSEELKSLSQAMGQILAGGIARTGVSSAVALIMLIVPLTVFVVSQSNVIETMNSSGMKE